MTTLDDVLAMRNKNNVLYPPSVNGSSGKSKSASDGITYSSNSTLSIGLHNSTASDNVYAYITGLAISNGHCLVLLESDGQTPYYPTNPSTEGSALSADCAIALGAPGTTRTVTIPYIAGGRIWFCVGNALTFLLNPSAAGPGLVEPSVGNTSDPNYHLSWDFCEFTYNDSQIYANISYVDFVSLPISLTLTSTTGSVQHVSGIATDGLSSVCNDLVAQNEIDGAGWDQLVITNNDTPLRALSPSMGMIFNPDLFSTYWDSYIDEVWSKYISTPLIVDTQYTWGVHSALTSNDRTCLTFPNLGRFPKPSSTDIFGANSGAFAPQAINTAELLNIGARLDAAFNRSTLLINSDHPNGEDVDTYYTNPITNHYARIVHASNIDGKGYCFPYDDVTPNGGDDQSGFVSDGSPANLLINVGGGNIYAKWDIAAPKVVERQSKLRKRSGGWKEDVKKHGVVEDEEVDLEKCVHPKLLAESGGSEERRLKLPAIVEKLLSSYLAKIQASPFYIRRIAPLLAIFRQLLVSLLTLSIRTIVSRVFVVVFFILFYFLGLLPHGSNRETQKRVLETVAVGNTNGVALV